MKKVRYCLASSYVFGMLTLSGCAGGLEAINPWESEDKGAILIKADAEGMRAFSDFTNGVITNTKTFEPGGNSAAWQLRHSQEAERTTRRAARKSYSSYSPASAK
jgi:hypothetical protein